MEFHMDKMVARKFKLGEEPKDYLYWLSQSAEIRIAGIESLRIRYYGEDPFKQGLQRVYRIIEQK
jgi:hypothetical protein